MRRSWMRGLMAAGLLAGVVPVGAGPSPVAAQEVTTTAPGPMSALACAASVEVSDSSGRILRTVNGALLAEGVVVPSASLDGGTRVRIKSREGTVWESAAVSSTHPLIGLSLLQLPESPARPVVFPLSGTYRARMRVFLINGPGVGPDTVAARIYENFELRGGADLCPIDVGTAGAAPVVDSTGRFLGVACDLSEGPRRYGFVVPAGSVRLLTTDQGPPRPVAAAIAPRWPGFENDSTATSLLFRGAVLTQVGQLDDARRFLHLAAERDPSLPEIYFWTGRALLAQEQYQQAAEEFRYAAARDSTEYRTWHLAGTALHLAGNYAEAERMYLRALAIRPDAAETHCTLGVAYLKMERAAEAEAAFRASIRTDPRYGDGLAYYNLASVMQHAKRSAAVDSICEELAQVDPAWAQRLREALAKKHH